MLEFETMDIILSMSIIEFTNSLKELTFSECNSLAQDIEMGLALISRLITSHERLGDNKKETAKYEDYRLYLDCLQIREELLVRLEIVQQAKSVKGVDSSVFK